MILLQHGIVSDNFICEKLQSLYDYQDSFSKIFKLVRYMLNVYMYMRNTNDNNCRERY